MLTHLAAVSLPLVPSLAMLASFLPHIWRLHHPAKGAPNRSPHLASLCVVPTQLPQRSFHKDLWVPPSPAVLTSMASCCIRKQRPSSLTTPFLNGVLCMQPFNKRLTPPATQQNSVQAEAMPAFAHHCEYTQLAFN